jgi:tRNA threonylcarbamoyladenosine biosynthesis protein TsaE
MRHVTIEVEKKKEKIDVPSVESWNLVVEKILPDLHPGMLIALSGPLGAGKTTFTQVLAKGFGIKKTPPSPTFALMRSYALPRAVQKIKRVVHVDAYRIENENEILPLDLSEELSDGSTLLVLEWPEKVPSFVRAFTDRMTLTIS